MITVTNRLRIAPEFAETIEKMLLESVEVEGGQQTVEGFISNHMLRPTKAGEPFLVMSFWTSREAYEAYLRSDAFKRDHDQSDKLPRQAFLMPDPSKIEIHEMVAQTYAPRA
jgi:heme oxygenase (mycobilin-producing)